MIAGWTKSFEAGHEDIFLINTDANGNILGTNNQSTIINNQFQIYPNPTPGKFILQLNQLKPQNIQLSIYNILGEKIYTQSSKQYQAGISCIEINLSAHPYRCK